MDEYTEVCNCGGHDCRGFKYMQQDPFAAEINDDLSEYLMCDEEAEQRRMDI